MSVAVSMGPRLRPGLTAYTKTAEHHDVRTGARSERFHGPRGEVFELQTAPGATEPNACRFEKGGNRYLMTHLPGGVSVTYHQTPQGQTTVIVGGPSVQVHRHVPKALMAASNGMGPVATALTMAGLPTSVSLPSMPNPEYHRISDLLSRSLLPQ